MSTIGFIGAGNMAQALIKGITKANVFKAENVFISDIKKERLDLLKKEYGVTVAESNMQLAGEADTLILSVKPQNFSDVLNEIKDAVNSNIRIVSIAAGIKISNISDILGDLAIIRVMPNTPALIGEGASALCANEKAKPMLEDAMKIFSAVGKAVVVDDEDLMDAVTAVSGSGPAYYFMLMEEMVKAAVSLGLKEEIATDLVLQTAKGASLLATQSPDSPAELRRKVTSPGGTTEAALKIFSENNISDIITKAITRARDRGRELSK